MNRGQQDRVSEQRGLPVEVVADSSFIVNVAGEAVSFYYYDAGGALTADAGQLAGTIIVGKTTNTGILKELGDAIGTHLDSSLTFTCDALTNEVAFPFMKAEMYDGDSGKQKAYKITEGFANGDYCFDYRNGVVYGKKATATASMTGVGYKIMSTTSSGGTVVTGDVNLAKVAGTVISDTNPVPIESTATSNATGISTLLDADADNTAQVLKAAAGNLYYIEAINSNAADAYIQLFNVAAGSVNVGTTVPKAVIYVPAQGGSVRDFNVPMSFATAMTYACTTTATGGIDPTTGLVITFGYK